MADSTQKLRELSERCSKEIVTVGLLDRVREYDSLLRRSSCQMSVSTKRMGEELHRAMETRKSKSTPTSCPTVYGRAAPAFKQQVIDHANEWLVLLPPDALCRVSFEQSHRVSRAWATADVGFSLVGGGQIISVRFRGYNYSCQAVQLSIDIRGGEAESWSQLPAACVAEHLTTYGYAAFAVQRLFLRRSNSLGALRARDEHQW